ncbi:MAG: hypothetical protein HEQ38_17035 [Gemmatimonas sp.]|nr:hypothetical protein [Gemmatimonas sp.]
MPTRVLQGVIRVEPEPAPLSRLDFRWRLTLEEQIAIERAMEEHPDPNVRAQLRILEKSLAQVTDASGVKVDDPRTQGGAAATVQVLVGAGVVTPANAPTRLAALLAPPA